MPDSFLILGCGSIGKRHIANLLDLGAGKITAFDPDLGRRREVAERFAVRIVENPAQALSERPLAVFICSPTNLHMEQARAAAEAGAHLFIEKPMSLNMHDVDRLIADVTARNLVALAGCNFRFHPGLRAVKELIDAAAIGRIVSARAQFGQYLPDWHPWEDYRKGYSARREMGGGVILDRIHEIDYIHWLLGPASHVFAYAERLTSLEIDCEDTAEIVLRLESGALCSVHLDYVRRVYDCSLEITGEGGSIQWSFAGNEVRWYTAESRQWQARTWPAYQTNEMYVEQLRHFLLAIHRRETPAQTLSEARRVLATALAAKQSAVEGRQIEVGSLADRNEMVLCSRES